MVKFKTRDGRAVRFDVDRSPAAELGRHIMRVLHACHPRQFARVRLALVRAMFHDRTEAELARAVIWLQERGHCNALTIDDPQEITADDRRAALVIAGERRHILTPGAKHAHGW